MRSRVTVAARLLLLTVFAMFAAPPAEAACVTGACLQTGPRLLTLDTQQSALLNPLVSALLGNSVTVTAADWQRLAGADVKIADVLELLRVQTGAGTTQDVLNGTVTLTQFLNAIATASGPGSTAAVGINNAIPQLNLPTNPISLANIIQLGTNAGDATVNVLDLVTGAIELHNHGYGATTPTPVSVGTPSAFGISGVNVVSLSARVVEPPVFYCGAVAGSTQFHTAAIRLKLDINIPQPLAQNGLLNLPPLVTASGLTVLPNFSVYVTVASAQGYLSAIDPAAPSMRVRVTPGVTSLYLGTIAASTFFDRTVQITAANFTPVTIGNITVTLLNIGLINGTVSMKSSATATAPVQEELIFNGPFPQTQSTVSSANSVGVLLTSLMSNLQLTANINLLGLVNLGAVADGFLPGVRNVISPVLSGVLTGIADPLLNLLGIKIGQAVVTAYGPARLCSVSGFCYDDSNHSGAKDVAEGGTGQALYAKLVATASPTTVYKSAIVNPVTGAFNFADVTATGAATHYSLILDTNATASDVTPARPSGWISTEAPTLTRAVALATADITQQNFGLYHGSSLAGRVFVDTGTTGGTANNAVRDGAEAALPGARVSITDNAGTTAYDSQLSGADGVYLLYVPASVGTATLKVVELNPSPYVSTGGSAGTTGGTYARATDTTTFTNSLGATYTGVDFAEVPATVFLTDGRQILKAGNVAFYPHRFIAGTAGTVTFGATATAMAGWNHALLRDANCNGAVEPAETVADAGIVVTPAQEVCLVARVFAAETAAYNDTYSLAIAASFAYANSGIVDALARSDVTLIGTASGAGLHLAKSVNLAAVAPGQTLTYTITYTNHSSGTLSSVRIHDQTPAFTVYASGACGALGAGLTNCALTTQPAVGAAGSLEWTLTGPLASGASGNVTFTVTVQ
jgi:uncharacterized repeat protein (TIGR01451 family)